MQKDTQKIESNTYGQNNPISSISLANKPIYEFINKKTEKLVTALYMVTDCMETDDALKSKLRLLGVELLSDMNKLSTLLPVDKNVNISVSLSRISETLSFIEIAHTIGFISEMNANILKKEFNILMSELHFHQSKDKHFTFTLDKDMFNIEKANIDNPGFFSNGNNIKDMSQHIVKKTIFNNMSVRNISIPDVSLIKKQLNHKSFVVNKQERSDKILSILKDKNDIFNEGITIKDISNQFSDCSEKTIQRELNYLVTKGLIKKNGSKRWSRYCIIPNK